MQECCDMTTEPEGKKWLWRAVAVMFFISCLLSASGVFEFIHDGHLDLFASLAIVLGGLGIIVTLVAWLLTFDL
jgi:tripartite tricarboxylate transporter family receptor